MPLNAISGNTFKKMVMKATGTKGYISSSVQNNLRANKASKFLNTGAKVTRQQATKVIQSLKQEGLAHKVTTNPTAYVKKSYAKEEHHQEMIKKQNVQQRAQELAAESASPKATQHSSTQQHGPLTTARAIPNQPTQSSSDNIGSASGVIKTDLKPGTVASNQPTRPPEWQEQDKNIQDLPID